MSDLTNVYEQSQRISAVLEKHELIERHLGMAQNQMLRWLLGAAEQILKGHDKDALKFAEHAVEAGRAIQGTILESTRTVIQNEFRDYLKSCFLQAKTEIARMEGYWAVTTEVKLLDNDFQTIIEGASTTTRRSFQE